MRCSPEILQRLCSRIHLFLQLDVIAAVKANSFYHRFICDCSHNWILQFGNSFMFCLSSCVTVVTSISQICFHFFFFLWTGNKGEFLNIYSSDYHLKDAEASVMWRKMGAVIFLFPICISWATLWGRSFWLKCNIQKYEAICKNTVQFIV